MTAREITTTDSLAPFASPAGGFSLETGSLPAEFLRVAAALPARPAVITALQTWSYADLLRGAVLVRRRLAALPNFTPGQRVALLLANRPEYIAAFYGTLLAGGVVVPLPPDTERDRREYILDSCAACCVWTTEDVLRRRPDLAGPRTFTLNLNDELAAATDRAKLDGAADSAIGNSDTLALAAVAPSDTTVTNVDALAALFFTSGSTGEPKGVMLSHRNLLSNARSIAEYLQIGAQDRALAILPFYHAFGNSVLQSHLLSGSALILDGTLTFPQTIIDALHKHEATSFYGVPDVYRVLLERSSLPNTTHPHLRYMACAGGALPNDQIVQMAECLRPARFYVMYGQTEATARLSYLPPDQISRRVGSIGRGLTGVELQVVDESGKEISPQQVGEIRARGPNIMLGYWKNPQGTAEILRDGWLYTGDLATIDQDGFIYPQGRRNALMKLGGYRVHPREIEEFVFQRFPVRQAVAVPYEAGQGGTRVALYLHVQSGSALAVQADDVIRLCRRELPRHKVPEYVEFVTDFPLNDALKIDRGVLSQRATTQATQASVPTSGHPPHRH